MTKSMIRMAAGVAVVFAVTVTGGLSAAVTSADPGSSKSPSDQSRDGGHSRDDGDGDGGGRQHSGRDGDRHGSGSSDRQGSSQRGNAQRGNEQRGDDRRDNGQRDNDRHGSVQSGSDSSGGAHDSKGGHGDAARSGRPHSGSSRGDDVEEDDDDKGAGKGDGGESTGVTAGRGTSGAVTDTPTASRGEVGGSDTPAVPAVDTPAAPTGGTPTVPTAAVTSAGGGGSASGSAVPIVHPRVVVGDGRAPGLVAQRPDEAPAPEIAAPALRQPPALVAAAAPRPARTPPPARPAVAAAASLIMESEPWPVFETPVASLWGRVQPGWPVGALFGIAGLLLAPTAGVWLGLRQARATRAAADLVSP